MYCSMELPNQYESGGQIKDKSWPSSAQAHLRSLMLFGRPPISRSDHSGSSSPAGPSSLNNNNKRAREEGGTEPQLTAPSSHAELDALKCTDAAGFTPADACLGLDHRPSSARHWTRPWKGFVRGARLAPCELAPWHTDQPVLAARADERMRSERCAYPGTGRRKRNK